MAAPHIKNLLVPHLVVCGSARNTPLFGRDKRICSILLLHVSKLNKVNNTNPKVLVALVFQ